MVNQEFAKIFREMAILLEMEETPFKPRAYEKAAFEIESLNENAEALYKKGGIAALEKISGIGRGIAKKIEEYAKTGKIKEYEKLKKKYPVNIEELNKIEGVGPKIIKALYKNLKIKNAGELKRAVTAGKLKKFPHFGEKLEKKILKGVNFLEKSLGKILLSEATTIAEKIENELKKNGAVKKITFCGSLRRRQETVGDLDILAVSKNPQKTIEVFVKLKDVKTIYAKGKTKALVRLANGIDADLRVVPEKSFGAALQYFTGSKTHNIELRKIAVQKGWKLNEYGLFKSQNDRARLRLTKSWRAGNAKLKIKENKKWIQVAGESEEEIYEKLGLKFIPPELRENEDEIETARKNELPKLIELTDIKGDLQLQTNWTDGADSIEDMAKKAHEFKYEYIAITDHTRSLAMTGGSDEKKLLRQIKEIEKINCELQTTNYELKILSGAEVNILKDGGLDINDKTLAKLDFVGVAIHSHFNLPKKEQTARLIRAMENANIDIIFHPTARVINKRESIDLDFEKIFKAATATKTILEIDGEPARLDLKYEHIKMAKKFGVKFIINTDAHSASQMDFMKYGVFTARRGWLAKEDVLNTLPLNEFLEMIKKPKNRRW